MCQPNAVAAKPLNYFDESPNFSSVVEITVKALPTALSEGKILLDVREDWERELSSIPNSLHMPLSQFDAANLDPSAAYIIYCKSGKRSAQACLKAAALKLDAVSLSGGINAYLAEPVPS